MSLPFVVHVGFPKTGTTTHQKHLFAKHSQVSYLGKPYENDILKGEILRLVMEESLTYDPAALKKYLLQLNAGKGNSGKKLAVLSEELLVSASKVRDKGIVAERIKEVFAPGKILVTIRNQVDALKSAYINGGRLLKNVPSKYKGLAIKFHEWLEMVFENPDRSYVGNIKYLNTINYYTRLWGKENICILLFEEFIHNKEEYIRQLSEFLEIDARESRRLLADQHENPRILQSQVDLELIRSKLGVKGKNPFISTALKGWYDLKNLFKKSQSARVDLPDPWRERLRDFYGESNRELMRNFNLPIDKYGYPL